MTRVIALVYLRDQGHKCIPHILIALIPTEFQTFLAGFALFLRQGFAQPISFFI